MTYWKKILAFKKTQNLWKKLKEHIRKLNRFFLQTEQGHYRFLSPYTVLIPVRRQEFLPVRLIPNPAPRLLKSKWAKAQSSKNLTQRSVR
jgi:hypothetical protein